MNSPHESVNPRFVKRNILDWVLGDGKPGKYLLSDYYNLPLQRQTEIGRGLEGIKGISVRYPSVGEGSVKGLHVEAKVKQTTYSALEKALNDATRLTDAVRPIAESLYHGLTGYLIKSS